MADTASLTWILSGAMQRWSEKMSDLPLEEYRAKDQPR
jgi:hypothetical protein